MAMTRIDTYNIKRILQKASYVNYVLLRKRYVNIRIGAKNKKLEDWLGPIIQVVGHGKKVICRF